MGYKSRGNFQVNICLRYDCINQGLDKICKKCFRFNLYEPFKKEKPLDAISEDRCKIT